MREGVKTTRFHKGGMVEKRVGPSEKKGRAQRRAKGKRLPGWKGKEPVPPQKGKSAEGSERQETNTKKTR